MAGWWVPRPVGQSESLKSAALVAIYLAITGFFLRLVLFGGGAAAAR